jgi:hypothetical protein
MCLWIHSARRPAFPRLPRLSRQARATLGLSMITLSTVLAVALTWPPV